jgi:hypothetical protein
MRVCANVDGHPWKHHLGNPQTVSLPIHARGPVKRFRLYGTIDDETFRQTVLVLLLLAGLSLIATALTARGP